MRKSTSVRLVLLGTAGLTLAACDEAPSADRALYGSASDCALTRSASECEKAAADADTIRVAEGPKFGRKEECEAEYGVGRCETRTDAMGSSFFLPLLAGYMLGNTFGSRPYPVYRDRDNQAIAQGSGPLGGSSFYKVGQYSGGAAAQPAAFQRTAATQVTRPTLGGTGVTRGGLGTSARVHGGTASS
jgi:uncharacterized protein YgiB involved in biofilm formation